MKIKLSEEVLINSEIKKVLPNVQDFTNWSKWSPWICFESDAEIKYTDKTSFGFKKMSWDGKIIGSGSLICTDATEELLKYDLAFLKPFKSKAKAEISISKQAENTKVKWSIETRLPFLLFFLKPMMTKMLSKDYKRGLKRLKSICEIGEVPAKLEFFDTPEIVESFEFSGISGKDISFNEIPTFMSEKFEIAEKEFEAKKAVKLEGYSFCDSYKFSKDIFDFTCGFGCKEKIEFTQLNHKTVPQHKAIKVKLSGSYDYLEDAWSGIMMYSRALKLKANKSVPPYEKYINHSKENSSECITEVYFPIR